MKAPSDKIPAAPWLPSWLNRDWLLGLTLVLAVVVTYQPVWQAGFIWDDSFLLTANPCIVGPLGLKEIWTTSAADICPLVQTTFWVEHAIWGLQPLPYHVVTVLLHGACAVVLWRVLRSLRVPGAWLGAALWALHPVQVESVAYITEMKNTQSCLFYLLTILFFVRWLRTREKQKRRGWSYALTLLFAALAMASKSSTVVLPVVLCLCAWWIEGRWHWRNLVSLAPIFVFSVAAGALSISTQKLPWATAIDPRWEHTWPERVITAGDAVWFYLGKLIWPHPLLVVYPRWKIDAGEWFSYLPLLAVIIILFILWRKRESWPRPWFFVFAYFLVALLPVLGLVNMNFLRYSFVADHFQYLASMGPLALAGAGLAWFADSVLSRRPKLQSALCSGLLVILTMTSWQRTWAYQSEETLWTDELSKNPDSWVGHNNLGQALSQKGRFNESMVEYKKALELYPNYAEAYYNIGTTLAQNGQVDEGIAQLQKAVEIYPNFVEARANLGSALAERGEVDNAIAQYEKALEIDPNLPHVHNDLAIVLFQKGRIDEAIAEFQKALHLKPDYRNAQDNLAKAQALARQKSGQK